MPKNFIAPNLILFVLYVYIFENFKPVCSIFIANDLDNILIKILKIIKK